MDKLADRPVIPKQNYYDARIDRWALWEYPDHPKYEEAMELHDRYVLYETMKQQHQAIQYVVNDGIVDVPMDLKVRYPDEEDTQLKVEWLLDKCKSQEEYLDVIDSIIGINMPTESGVQKVLESFQSIILDHGELVPLTEWKSNKERKGGLVMSLYAEGLLACSQLNGIITLQEYFALPGDPRYIQEDARIPLSMCHIIGLNRLNVKSSNATQEIELSKDTDKGNVKGKDNPYL